MKNRFIYSILSIALLPWYNHSMEVSELTPLFRLPDHAQNKQDLFQNYLHILPPDIKQELAPYFDITDPAIWALFDYFTPDKNILARFISRHDYSDIEILQKVRKVQRPESRQIWLEVHNKYRNVIDQLKKDLTRKDNVPLKLYLAKISDDLPQNHLQKLKNNPKYYFLHNVQIEIPLEELSIEHRQQQARYDKLQKYCFSKPAIKVQLILALTAIASTFTYACLNTFGGPIFNFNNCFNQTAKETLSLCLDSNTTNCWPPGWNCCEFTWPVSRVGCCESYIRNVYCRNQENQFYDSHPFFHPHLLPWILAAMTSLSCLITIGKVAQLLKNALKPKTINQDTLNALHNHQQQMLELILLENNNKKISEIV